MRAVVGLVCTGALALAGACGGLAPGASAVPAGGGGGVVAPGKGGETASAATPAPASEPAPEPASEPASASEPAPEPEPEPASASADGSSCNAQPPQDFLIRGTFLKSRDGNRLAIQYRTDHYGYFKGFGQPAAGAKPPSDFLQQTSFMGLPIKMHRKVVPALACVEAEIKRSCADARYTPHALAGIRYRNTYRGGEVTNHAYGIAIDIDPDINTCCGCVPPWNDAPRCKRPAKTEYDRMVMPECWVHAFERFGFYWLGHDVLRDTMHFEFLGDPDQIAKSGGDKDVAAKH